MSIHHQTQKCSWVCPWKGSRMCAQCLLNSQALADGRVTLGVICGLRSLYHPHPLPPCITGNVVNFSSTSASVA